MVKSIKDRMRELEQQKAELKQKLDTEILRLVSEFLGPEPDIDQLAGVLSVGLKHADRAGLEAAGQAYFRDRKSGGKKNPRPNPPDQTENQTGHADERNTSY